MTTETPETDAFIDSLNDDWDYEFAALTSHACKLERERDEASGELHKQLEKYDSLFDEAEKIRMERDEARAECLEQCKLLAMSADREEKLRTDLTLARKLADSAILEADRYRVALKNIAALDTSQDASPQQCGAVLLAMNALDP